MLKITHHRLVVSTSSSSSTSSTSSALGTSNCKPVTEEVYNYVNKEGKLLHIIHLLDDHLKQSEEASAVEKEEHKEVEGNDFYGERPVVGGGGWFCSFYIPNPFSTLKSTNDTFTKSEGGKSIPTTNTRNWELSEEEEELEEEGEFELL